MTRLGWGVLFFSISLVLFLIAMGWKRGSGPEQVVIGISPHVFLRSPFEDILTDVERSLDDQILLRRLMESLEVNYVEPGVFEISGDLQELNRIFIMETGEKPRIEKGNIDLATFSLRLRR